MKKILFLAALVFAAVLMTSPAYAAADYRDKVMDGLSEADVSGVADGLSDLGIDPADPESVTNLDTGGIFRFVLGTVGEALQKPLRAVLLTVIFAAICRIATSLSYKAGLYGEIFVLLCFMAVAPYAAEAFVKSAEAMKSCHTFMLTYIPAFAGVAAASGNITAAVSYNAIVVYFCEAAAFFATAVFRPILGCMLVMSVTQAIDPDLSGLTSSVRNALTVMIGFVMTLFLGVLSLQTIVGRGVDGLAVRAGKYAVSSFVPIIGYSLSESYNAVSVSLSAIRTAVGAFGIVVLALYMLSPIVVSLVYKTAFNLCGWICRLIGADRIAAMSSGLGDVFGFSGTVLTVFMLMLTVSTGMLILLGGALTA